MPCRASAFRNVSRALRTAGFGSLDDFVDSEIAFCCRGRTQAISFVGQFYVQGIDICV
jgi:hypothetical protein